MTGIASVGPNLPVEVLHATGRYAGPLGWTIDRAFPRASQWLESKFPLWAFSILEDWDAGAFANLSQVVFSRGDDSAQRLYYYICELQRQGILAGPEPLIFDLAQIPRETSLGRTERAVANLAERLGVAETDLAAAGELVHEIIAASSDRVCLLTGTPPPDRRVHEMIARAGWDASGPTLADLWRGEASGGATYAGIARRVHETQTGPRNFRDRAVEIATRATAARASAAVIWYAEEDEAEIWHLPEQRRALDDAGIPALVPTRRDWRGNDGLEAEIATFLAGVSP